MKIYSPAPGVPVNSLELTPHPWSGSLVPAQLAGPLCLGEAALVRRRAASPAAKLASNEPASRQSAGSAKGVTSPLPKLTESPAELPAERMSRQLSPNQFAERFANSFRNEIASILGKTPEQVDARLVSIALAQSALETNWVKSLWNWNFGGLRADPKDPTQPHAYLPSAFEDYPTKNEATKAMHAACLHCGGAKAGKSSEPLANGRTRVWFNRGAAESRFAAYPNEAAGVGAFFDNKQKQYAIRLLAARLPELDKAGFAGHALVREMVRVYDAEGLQNTPGAGEYHSAKTSDYQIGLRVRYESQYLGVHRFVLRALSTLASEPHAQAGTKP